jgi:dihydrofolate reductase
MNALPKYVPSTTLSRLEWNNSQVIKGDLAPAVRKLKEESGQNILVNGSCELVQGLMRHDLIDEYRLMVHPIVVGGGKRAFPDGVDRKTLDLVDAKPLPAGVVVLTYRPKR